LSFIALVSINSLLLCGFGVNTIRYDFRISPAHVVKGAITSPGGLPGAMQVALHRVPQVGHVGLHPPRELGEGLDASLGVEDRHFPGKRQYLRVEAQGGLPGQLLAQPGLDGLHAGLVGFRQVGDGALDLYGGLGCRSVRQHGPTAAGDELRRGRRC
jgi:hypothetical protein